MSDEKQPPDWSLLPGHPERFFDLPSEFDRKELKRSYNRLIRRFKPERFPEEFQKIRAAYEQLDNQLRYGHNVVQAAQERMRYRWKTDEAAAAAGDEATTEPKQDQGVSSRQPSLREQVLQEPLEQVYRGLSKKSEKLPYDFYALAVISDIVHRQDGLQFLRWILQGATQFPHDQGLLSLLYEYLRGPVPEPAIQKILLSVSKAVPNDRFYALTEQLWQRLLECAPFEDFRRTLDACTSNLKGVEIDGRLVFTISLMKSAIWHADEIWIEQTTVFIEENFERIPGHLEFDVDLIDFIKRYRSQNANQECNYKLRRRIEQAMRDYFTKDQAAGDQSVIECQIEIARNPGQLLHAFPFDVDEEFSDLYALWNYVSSDVAERHVEIAEPANIDAWNTRGRALYERIERKINASLIGKRWSLLFSLYGIAIAVYYVISIFLVVGFSLMFFIDVRSEGLAILATVGGVVGGFFLCYWLQSRFMSPRWQRYAQNQATKGYSEYGRLELAEFLQRSRFSYQELRTLLHSCDISNLKLAQGIFDRYQFDYALALYSIAIAFQA